jgi:hypothetical protein
MNRIIDFSLRKNCEETIQKTWAEFRQQLSDGKFLYNDVASALQCTFLHVFDDVFKHCYIFFEKSADKIFNKKTAFVRAARINPKDPSPDYDRFIPKTEFITEDNRFSPPGVEWLYLAFATQTVPSDLRLEERCALKECRAEKGEKFALCDFRLNEKYKDKNLVDLTFAKEKGFADINEDFDRKYQEVYKEVISKLNKKRDVVFKPQINLKHDITFAIEKWTAYTYAKLLTEQIFLPVATENKTLMYAPFQCVAQYFLSKDYCGIVYSSTVFPSGKNVVLFDKLIAYPCGKIRTMKIPNDL